jgi:adenosylmethionine-8-amino-7-oxononanoate aminotransferase
MTKESYSLAERIGTQVAEVARAAGLLLRPLGNIIVIMPPLSTTATELRAMVRIVSQAITTVTKV